MLSIRRGRSVAPLVGWRPFCSILIYTANADGVHLRTDDHDFSLEEQRIEPVSTIGAGDTFNAGILYGLFRKGYAGDVIRRLEKWQWEELINGAIDFSREVCLSYDNYIPLDYAEKVKQEQR